jgi:hypothetical protein
LRPETRLCSEPRIYADQHGLKTTTKMTAVPEGFVEIDSCYSLLVREITEPRENSLRLMIEEAFLLPEEVTVAVGGTEITGGHPIRSVEGSRLFEIIWDFYVAYSVRNESYVARDESEVFSGRFARVYSRSHFLDYVSRATFACNEHLGPMQHVALVSENHIVDVVSTALPRVRQIRPAPAVH